MKIQFYEFVQDNDRGKYFYLFADLGQGIVSVKSMNRERFPVVRAPPEIGRFFGTCSNET